MYTEFAMYTKWLILRKSGKVTIKTQKNESKIWSANEKKITNRKEKEIEIQNKKEGGRELERQIRYKEGTISPYWTDGKNRPPESQKTQVIKLTSPDDL